MAKGESNFVDLADKRLGVLENTFRLIGNLGNSSYQADRTPARVDYLENEIRRMASDSIAALKGGKRVVVRKSIGDIK